MANPDQKPQYPKKETEIVITDPLEQKIAEQRILTITARQYLNSLIQQSSGFGTAIDGTLGQMDRLGEHINPLG